MIDNSAGFPMNPFVRELVRAADSLRRFPIDRKEIDFDSFDAELLASAGLDEFDTLDCATVDESLMEAYSFGRLAEPILGLLEEHLLVCEACCDKIEESEEYIGLLGEALRRTKPAAPSREERRSEPRWTARKRVRFVLSGYNSRRPPFADTRIDAALLDVSVRGMGITCSMPLVVGSLALFRLPGGREGMYRVCSCGHHSHGGSPPPPPKAPFRIGLALHDETAMIVEYLFDYAGAAGTGSVWRPQAN